MNEKEMFELWDGQTSISKELPAISEVEKMARQKSTDVFKKIKTNIIIEFIIAIPLCIISIPIMFSSEKELFWISIAITSLALFAGIKIYGKYLNAFKKLNQLNIVESLEKKIAILKRYVKQLNFYLIVFMPLGLILGILLSHGKSNINIQIILNISLVTLPFLLLCIWLGKKYIYQLYGRHLEQIQEIYSQLVEDINK
ncbi:hypothetical protein [Flavobacterium sp.]|jgi:hypothetical protein|uniref:hypothetical protein n=1 Tax=Flavobacterium sp. TaxID=239 RepID=UPI0037BF7B9F